MQLLAKNLTFLKEDDHLEEIKQQWRNQSMTNFDYLTYLNKLSGRTFNDLMQYPVFPFVLGQYETLTLNLKNPKTYRLVCHRIYIFKSFKKGKCIKSL